MCYTCLRPAVMSLCSYSTNGLVSTIAPDYPACILQQPCLYKLHTINMHVCYSCIYQQICLNQLQLTYKYIYICLRPAVMSLSSYPTNRLVSTIVPDHHACILQLHLTSSHVFISCILSTCMSVTVSSYQDPSILHLHPPISHVCNNCVWPFPMSLTVASNQQSYL